VAEAVAVRQRNVEKEEDGDLYGKKKKDENSWLHGYGEVFRDSEKGSELWEKRDQG